MKILLVTEDVGGLQVKAIRPVVASVREILTVLRKEDAALSAALKPYGGFCVWVIRRRPGQFSSHAFGIALDLGVHGGPALVGGGRTQYGLVLLAKLFEERGFALCREDGIHFEASAELLQC